MCLWAQAPTAVPATYFQMQSQHSSNSIVNMSLLTYGGSRLWDGGNLKWWLVATCDPTICNPETNWKWNDI